MAAICLSLNVLNIQDKGNFVIQVEEFHLFVPTYYYCW